MQIDNFRLFEPVTGPLNNATVKQAFIQDFQHNGRLYDRALGTSKDFERALASYYEECCDHIAYSDMFGSIVTEINDMKFLDLNDLIAYKDNSYSKHTDKLTGDEFITVSFNVKLYDLLDGAAVKAGIKGVQEHEL